MKDLGIGLGLRAPHYDDIISGPVQVDWFEALTENYFVLEGAGYSKSLKNLLKIRERFPIVLHGVSLSIGSVDPLNIKYLNQLKELVQMVEPEWISDHLCWTGIYGINSHDLLPLPYTKESINNVVRKVEQTQEYLGRKILLENVSSYINFKTSQMKEWEFFSEVQKRSGCLILLDLNNIYVSSVNHSFDPLEYLRGIPEKGAVQQIHLAGPTDHGSYLVDTHDSPVLNEVWGLYEFALKRFGAVSTMVEWDSKIPSYKKLEKEAMLAKKLREKVLKNAPAFAKEFF